MAVETTDPRIVKTAGNDVLLAFDFAFKIFADTDLRVEKINAAGVYSGALTLDVDYTVEFDSDEETGTVTFAVAPVTGGYAVIIGSELPQSQEAAFPREGVTPASVQKNAYDKLTLLVQQLTEVVSRCVKYPMTPVNQAAIIVSEEPVDRRALVYEDDGDGGWNVVPSTYDPDEQVILAIAQVALATAQAVAAAASAVAAAISAAAALASQTAAAISETNAAASAAAAAASASAMVGTSGPIASRPVGGAVRLWYYATDDQQEWMWSPAAGRWFLVG